jgi:hypothetical protein
MSTDEKERVIASVNVADVKRESGAKFFRQEWVNASDFLRWIKAFVRLISPKKSQLSGRDPEPTVTLEPPGTGFYSPEKMAAWVLYIFVYVVMFFVSLDTGIFVAIVAFLLTFGMFRHLFTLTPDGFLVQRLGFLCTLVIDILIFCLLLFLPVLVYGQRFFGHSWGTP